jgi:hypothetical protein
MIRLSACLCLLGALTASACSMAGEGPQRSREPVRVPEQQASAPVATASSEVPAAILDKLRADLVSQKGVSAADVKVVSAQAVNWPNGGLGCSKPGEMVTQAIVPGYRVEIEAAGRRYTYHVAERGYFRLC